MHVPVLVVDVPEVVPAVSVLAVSVLVVPVLVVPVLVSVTV